MSLFNLSVGANYQGKYLWYDSSVPHNFEQTQQNFPKGIKLILSIQVQFQNKYHMHPGIFLYNLIIHSF